MERRVKGSLFVDYVRMLRTRKDVDWSRYLLAEDLPYLARHIDPDQWYPMETFARFGLAILDEVAQGDTFLARAWGRMSLDHLVTVHEGLLVQGDPRESLMRLFVLRGSFFDFDAVSLPQLTDSSATVEVHYGMTPRAEQAAAFQTLGFFGRLAELAGGRGVLTRFTRRSWEGDASTEFTVEWQPPEPVPGA
jgi:hypothetical protein